jgi:hypothetical protein
MEYTHFLPKSKYEKRVSGVAQLVDEKSILFFLKLIFNGHGRLLARTRLIHLVYTPCFLPIESIKVRSVQVKRMKR